MFEHLELMLHPQFKVGDQVKFECSQRKPHNQPRWIMNYDTTGNGIWAYGEVTEIKPDVIMVEYEIEEFAGKGMSQWPNLDHPEYNSNQWHQDGYLRRLDREQLICECGAEIVFGENTSHSSWCPMTSK